MTDICEFDKSFRMSHLHIIGEGMKYKTERILFNSFHKKIRIFVGFMWQDDQQGRSSKLSSLGKQKRK